MKREIILPFPAAPSAHGPRATFASLTAMRGVAALLVAFFHLRWGVMGIPLFDAYIFSFRFGNRGYLWVDFFFILSGFILAYRYGESCRVLTWKGYGHFLRQRIARIWPLHLVTMGIAIIYLGVKHGAHHYFKAAALLTNLFLVHSWGYYFAPTLDFPSWSLSCEWGAYLVLPFYLWLVHPIRRGLIHLFLAGGLFALLVWFADHFSAGLLDYMRDHWGLARCLLEVGIGVSLYHLHTSLDAWKKTHSSRVGGRFSLASDAAAAAIFCGIFVVFTYTRSDLYFVPLAGALILALSLAQGPFSVLLQRPFMILLGEISFSIYMLHAFVMWACQDIPSSLKAHIPFWGGAVWLLLSHLVVIGLAWLSFNFMERPAHRLLTGRQAPSRNA